jgi:hypothetical protein
MSTFVPIFASALFSWNQVSWRRQHLEKGKAVIVSRPTDGNIATLPVVITDFLRYSSECSISS